MSVLMSWYTISYEFEAPVSITYTTDIDFKTREVVSTVYINGEEISNSSASYEDSTFYAVGDVMKIELVMMVLAIPLAGIFMVSAFFDKRSFSLVFGGAAAALCLASVIYLPVSIEEAVNESAAELGIVSELLAIDGFTGSKTVLFIDVEWGPSVGWAMAILATAMMVVGLLGASRGPR